MIRTGWFLALSSFLIAAAPLCADELDPWLAQLNSRQSKERSAAEAELKKRVKAPQLPRLVSFYKTCQLMACYGVIRLVDGVGGPPARAALKQMVPLRIDYGAYYAASSLKYRHQDMTGFDYLLIQIRSPATPKNFRYTLVGFLPSMGEKGRQTLVEMASDVKLSSKLRIRALDRLADYPERKDEVKVAGSLQGISDPGLRLAADIYLYARGKLTQVQRLEASVLAGKLEYSQTYTLLRAIEKRKDTERKKLLIYLLEHGKNGYIKANALRTMAAIGLTKLVVEKAQGLVNDKDSYLKREARKLMVQYGRTSIADLKKQLEKGTLLDRVDAAEMLVQLDDYSGEKLLLEALRASNVQARRKAAGVLGKVLSRKALTPLARALSDSDLSVRSQAYSSLRRLVAALLPYRNLDWKRIGFQTSGSVTSRSAAVGKLTAWLEKVLRDG